MVNFCRLRRPQWIVTIASLCGYTMGNKEVEVEVGHPFHPSPNFTSTPFDDGLASSNGVDVENSAKNKNYNKVCAIKLALETRGW